MRIGEDRMSWLPSLLNPNARVRLTTRALTTSALTTLLGVSPFTTSEEAYVARHQFIDFEGAGYNTEAKSIGTDENMDHLYVLHQPEDYVNSHNVEIWPRVKVLGVTGYSPDSDIGPLNCNFDNGTSIVGDVSVSPDGRWLAVSDQQGYAAFSPLYEPTWDGMTNQGYIIDLTAPNRSCSPEKLYDLFAFHRADAVFSADSQSLLFGIPYAGNPPTNSPEWGSTVGQIHRYSQSDGNSWDFKGNIRLFTAEGLNQNAGVGKSVVTSRDGSVTAIYAESLRIKESENGGEYVQTQFGYIPEQQSRTPSYPLIAIVSDGIYQFRPLALDNEDEYVRNGYTKSNYTGQQLAITDDGDMVVTAYLDRTSDNNGPDTKIQTLTPDRNGAFGSSSQVVDLRKCIDPETDELLQYRWADPYDLALSSDGERLAVLVMIAFREPAGVCLFSREGDEWQPLIDASRALSAVTQSNGFNAVYTTAEIIANKDLTRLLIHHGNAATQADIEWSSGTNGLPIWLLYEASRAGD